MVPPRHGTCEQRQYSRRRTYFCVQAIRFVHQPSLTRNTHMQTDVKIVPPWTSRNNFEYDAFQHLQHEESPGRTHICFRSTLRVTTDACWNELYIGKASHLTPRIDCLQLLFLSSVRRSHIKFKGTTVVRFPANQLPLQSLSARRSRLKPFPALPLCPLAYSPRRACLGSDSAIYLGSRSHPFWP